MDKNEQFSERDLVWRVKLPIGSKDSKSGKWSPNSKGPYRIKRCAPSNTYILEILQEEEEFGRAIKWRVFKGILP